jgi:hypothetical protein
MSAAPHSSLVSASCCSLPIVQETTVSMRLIRTLLFAISALLLTLHVMMYWVPWDSQIQIPTCPEGLAGHMANISARSSYLRPQVLSLLLNICYSLSPLLYVIKGTLCSLPSSLLCSLQVSSPGDCLVLLEMLWCMAFYSIPKTTFSIAQNVAAN